MHRESAEGHFLGNPPDLRRRFKAASVATAFAVTPKRLWRSKSSTDWWKTMSTCKQLSSKQPTLWSILMLECDIHALATTTLEMVIKLEYS